MSRPPAPFVNQFNYDIYAQRYGQLDEGVWDRTSHRVTNAVMGDLFKTHGARDGVMSVPEIMDAQQRVYRRHSGREFIAGGRYLYMSGREYHQVNNCLLLRCEDTRESWGELSHNATMALMTGAGIGVYYDVRPEGSPLGRTGGVASGAVPGMRMVNEVARNVMQGGHRRSAVYAAVNWKSADIPTFLAEKAWDEETRVRKADTENYPNYAAPLDMTNVSVQLDEDFFRCYDDPAAVPTEWPAWWTETKAHAPGGQTWHQWAHYVYDETVRLMTSIAEPGFQVDVGPRKDEVLRNACTEITSADDSDVCNLGSLVISRFDSPAKFEAAVRDAVLFLLGGTLYSHVPYAKVADVRDKNRRLGLGLMGLHEFVMLRGAKYGTDESFELLEPYMARYDRALEFACDWADKLKISRPVGATAIAPNGTIGIVAETTPSGDPDFSAAERRRVRVASPSGDVHVDSYVVSPVAQKMLAAGVSSDVIEDAYTIAEDYERRFKQQVYLQSHVDHAVSTTVNLPHVDMLADPVDRKAFGDTLMKYLPRMRGVTCYPDGAIPGQPRTAVPLELALQQDNVQVEQKEDTCVGGVCGI